MTFAAMGVLALIGSTWQASADAATGAIAAATPAMPPTPQGANNQVCLGCHSNPSQQMKAANGETISLYVDPDAFKTSVHGAKDIACVMCHTQISSYPHREYKPADRRQVTLDLYQSCKQCHSDNYEKSLDSVHQRALASGNRLGAVCTDCHGAHDVRPPNQPRWRIALTCSKCHGAIFDQYKDSVHGSALQQDNADVPSCVDCHGVHNIPDPMTQAFRLKSPTEMCGKCHTDAKIMSKYDLSANVLSSYAADFHGTTVEIFEKQSPDQATNKPVCFDCHGVHNIASVKDPKTGLEIKSNLLKTCQKCHPDATTESFTASWLSHYAPSPTQYPVVYYVTLFYNIFVPSVLALMVLLVVLDAARRIRNRVGAAHRVTGKEA
jgi:hypothetical protein